MSIKVSKYPGQHKGWETHRLWQLPVKPHRIYLAGPMSEQGEVSRFALQLQDAGFEVTSRWLRHDFNDKPEKSRGGAVGESSEFFDYEAKWGRMDVEDMERADTLLILGKEKTTSGGYHVELGYFLGAKRQNIIVVGDRWNVFFYTEEVRWTKNTAGLIEWLQSPDHGIPPAPAFTPPSPDISILPGSRDSEPGLGEDTPF